MPRPPRIDLADGVYHVTSRGNGRVDVFLSDDDRQRLLGQLARHLQLTVSRHFGITTGSVPRRCARFTGGSPSAPTR